MIEISKIYFTLGNKVEKNEEVEKELGLKKNSIKKLTGINKRYIADEQENVISLSIKSAKKILLFDEEHTLEERILNEQFIS